MKTTIFLIIGLLFATLGLTFNEIKKNGQRVQSRVLKATDRPKRNSPVDYVAVIQADAPTLTTVSANYITENSAICGGNVTMEGSSPVQSRGVVLSEYPGPTTLTAINVDDIGNGIGYYTVLAGLKPSTTYYMRAWARNGETIGYGNELSFTTASVDTTLPSTFTDPRDGEVYTIKRIGGIVWMTKNLNYKRYASPDDYTSKGVLYQNFYPNTLQTSENIYPKDSISPPGWHIATNHEWKYLFKLYGATDGDYVGDLTNTGAAAKRLLSVSEGGNDSSGFHASFDHASAGGTGFYSHFGFEPGNFVYYYFTSNINGPYIREGYEDGGNGQRLKLYARCVADDTLKLTKNPITEGKFKIIDPKPSLVNDNGTLNGDLTKLDTNKIVKGVATDGITKLLLYFTSSTPITFQIDNLQDGTLQQLTSNGPGTNLSITISPDAQGHVIAVYKAPDGYGANPSRLASRQISVKVDFGNGLLSSLSLKLVTPPVILIHGMWSDPSVWSKGGFTTKLDNSGIRYFLADYDYVANRTYNPDSAASIIGRRSIQAIIYEAFNFYHTSPDLKVAVTQVDIVAHSLGSLLTRSYSQSIDPLDKTNFHQGTIHKLITLDAPHNGSPLGKELWDHRDSLLKFGPSFGKLSAALAKQDMPIGTCHRDFGINSTGLASLKSTYPFKTYAIRCNAADGQNTGRIAMNTLCLLAFRKTLATVMASSCDVSKEVPNDLIVPVSSQKGFNDNDGKGEEFLDIAHSTPGFPTVISSAPVHDRVVELLFSANKNDFGVGFPAPSSLTRDCNTTTERIQQQNSLPSVMSAATLREGDITKYIKITSPISGAIYSQGTSIPVTITFEPAGGTAPLTGLFMVGDLGWFPIPSSPPYSINVTIPSTTDPGKLNILALATDGSGMTMADTSSVYISLPNGWTIKGLSVIPSTIALDSSLRTQSLSVSATLSYYSQSQTFNITSAGPSTVSYTTLKSNVVRVNQDGTVVAIAPGTDTIIVRDGLAVKVPVTVAANFNSALLFPNEINFPPISDKLVGDGVFPLTASASSGDDVNYSIVSGPATVVNGIVTINGPGRVIIQATSEANSYFSAAAPVTQAFNVTGGSTYTFIGNGNWNTAANWSNNVIPPSILPGGSNININPSVGGKCILNVPQTISQGAILTVQTGANFVIQGNLTSQ